ncbi:MAG: hypothetical protein JWP61_1688 [Friedmanniella sp.]|nr:hypothetical protein [Friedmanniella sp.]
MIGYYIHHHGSGHLHRALAIQAEVDTPVTGLSTAARPAQWRGPWVQLPDDAGADGTEDLSAHGRLHYVPRGHAGLRDRMAAIAGWIAAHDPRLMVVDVSVEVALLARLHGVPVVTVAQPGGRGDAGHRLGYDISSTILAPWPAEAGPLWEGSPADAVKTRYVGPVARFRDPVGTPLPRRVVVLNGTGGAGPTAADVSAARAATPEWEWLHLDREHGTWVDDPWPVLCSATVVVSHAGQNAVAEISAARRPAILLPQDRPFGEQYAMARALERLAWAPVRACSRWPTPREWPLLLERVRRLDGASWSRWNDGLGVGRAAALLTRLAAGLPAAELEGLPA